LTSNSRSYLNRWTQPDTIVSDPYNPQSNNRYSYVLNNPCNNIDPTGKIICKKDLGLKGPVSEDSFYEKCGNAAWSEHGEASKYELIFDNLREFIKSDIDAKFEPIAGQLTVYGTPVTVPLEYSNIIDATKELYKQNNINLDEVTINGQPNPLDIAVLEEKNSIAETFFSRTQWQPYIIFLTLMGLGTNEDSYMNFEPTYLFYLMKNNKSILQTAKNTYIFQKFGSNPKITSVAWSLWFNPTLPPQVIDLP
jgi:hypothetical protein